MSPEEAEAHKAKQEQKKKASQESIVRTLSSFVITPVPLIIILHNLINLICKNYDNA